MAKQKKKQPADSLAESSINKNELAKELKRKFGLPQKFAYKIIEAILNIIASQLNQGKMVRLQNFGSFQMRNSHGKLRPKFNPSPNILKRRLR